MELHWYQMFTIWDILTILWIEAVILSVGLVLVRGLDEWLDRRHDANQHN